MGNCCCVVRELNYKPDGTKFYELPYFVGRDYEPVFKFISNRYPGYKIKGVKENSFEQGEKEKKTVYMYFNESGMKITAVEVYP